MFVKLAKQKEILSNVKIGEETYPVRWEIDEEGNATLAVARVDGLGYDRERNLYKVGIDRNVDTFTKDFTVGAGSESNVVFNELAISHDTLDLSDYRYMDFHVRGVDPHEFEWTGTTSFRNYDGQFGEYSASGSANIKEISDVFYTSSLESSSSSHRYLVGLNIKIIQGLFRFRLVNRSESSQDYTMELRLYK